MTSSSAPRQTEGARRFGEPVIRHLMGRVFNRVVRLVAVGGFEDTQCGFKMCSEATLPTRCSRCSGRRGFGFDVEVLFIAKRRGASILEMPIDWHHEPSSKISPVADSVRHGHGCRPDPLAGPYRSLSQVIAREAQEQQH